MGGGGGVLGVWGRVMALRDLMSSGGAVTSSSEVLHGLTVSDLRFGDIRV